MSHELTIYSSDELAKNAYSSWESKWFPTEEWKTPDNISINSPTAEDLFRLGCDMFTIDNKPIQSCTYLHQHERMISLVIFNIDNESISSSQAEEILKTLDDRMVSYAGPLPDEVQK
jgi:hypothetical protein